MATPSQGATGVLREARAPQFLSEDEEKDLFYLGEPSRNFQNLGNAMSFIILPELLTDIFRQQISGVPLGGDALPTAPEAVVLIATGPGLAQALIRCRREPG